jgi:hypothetical protein
MLRRVQRRHYESLSLEDQAMAKATLGLLQHWLLVIFLVVMSSGCESSCPRGLVKINNRCRAIAADASVDAEIIAPDAGNSDAATGGARTQSMTSGVSTAGGGGAGSAAPTDLAGSGGSGGSGGSDAATATPTAGAGGQAPETAGSGPVTTPEDVCANASGEAVCDGAELHVCGDDGRTASVETCADATLCETGAASGRCAACDPGAHRCDGARLDVCDASGQFVLQETCATAELCKEDAGACTEMKCQPEVVACSSDRASLNTCNADGSDFADVQSCGTNGCDQEHLRCNNCRPGAKSCSGEMLVTCSNDGQTQQMMRCVPANDNGCGTASCGGDACAYGHKAPGSACKDGGKCNASGACVECITQSDCPAPGACYEASCSSNGSCDTRQKPDGTSCGNNRVCRRGECEAPPKTVELRSYYSAERGDNYTTGTAEGAQSALDAGYTFVRIEGYAFESSQPGTVPLRLYYSDSRGDNFTTGTADGEASARAAEYGYVRVEGYVYEAAQPGAVPLKSYWHPERADNFMTGTVAGENDALAAGYTHVRVEGYALTSPNR